MASDQDSAWTDERLDERMTSLDRTIGLMQNDIGGIRTELLAFRRQHSEEMLALRAEMQAFRSAITSELQQFRSEFSSELQQFRSDSSSELQSVRSELGSEIRLLRADVTTVQDRLVQIGFGLVGVLVVALCSLVVAVA